MKERVVVKWKKWYQEAEISRCEQIIGGLFLVLLPAVSFYLMETYEHNAFAEVRKPAGYYNILLMELIAWILFFLTGRVRTAIRLQWTLAMLFGLVNHYVMLFRSTPFVPWDIYSIRTAASVADNYDFSPSGRVVLVTLGFLLVIAGVQLLRARLPRLTLPEGIRRRIERMVPGAHRERFVQRECAVRGLHRDTRFLRTHAAGRELSDKSQTLSVSLYAGLYDEGQRHGGHLCDGSCLPDRG